MKRSRVYSVQGLSRLLTFILIGTLISSCISVGFGPITAEEEISQDFEAPDNLSVMAETFNGDIVILAGSAGQVQVNVTKRGAGTSQQRAEQDLENIDVSITLEGNTLDVIAKRTGGSRMGNSGAEIFITLPPEVANLDLTTSNGEISTRGVKGEILAHTSNGAVIVEGGTGRLDLETSNGRIDVTAENSVVSALTSNGRINFVGSLASGESNFETSNGSIEITLPSDAAFELDADTSNGSVTCDFDITISGTVKKDRLTGTVGENPQTTIVARSSNGSIRIQTSP